MLGIWKCACTHASRRSKAAEELREVPGILEGDVGKAMLITGSL
jgi:hypothetical protein